MNIKKYLGIILAICIIFSGMSVFADNSILFESADPSALAWTNGTVVRANAIGGMVSDNYCGLVSITSGGSAYYQFDNAGGERFDTSFKGNYVIDFKFFAGSGFGDGAVSVTTNWGSLVSAEIGTASPGFRTGKWNSVRVIYNSSNVVASEGLLGVKSTYLNGTKLEEKQWWRPYSSPFNVFRIGISGADGTADAAYFDDFKIWTTSEDVPVAKASFEGNVIIDGNQLQISKGTTLSDICGGVTEGVAAFRDEAMTQRLSDTEELMDNDIVSVVLDDGSIDYYIVSTCGYKLLANDETGSSVTNVSSSEEAAGNYGKTSDDKTAYVKRVMTDNNPGNHKVYPLYEFGTQEANNKRAAHIAASVDFCLVKPIERIYLATRWGERISPNITGRFELNQWNRITFVYQPRTYTDSYWGDVTVYLNGEEIAFGGMPRNAGSTNFINQLRITFDNHNEILGTANEIEGYFDNFNVYRKMNVTSLSLPRAQIETNADTGYIVSGNTLYFKDGLSVSDIPASAVVWNSGWESVAGINDGLYEGMHAVLANEKGILTYYEIKSIQNAGIVFEGAGVNGDTCSGGDVNAYFMGSEGNEVILASYDRAGRLKNVSIHKAASGLDSVFFNCDDTDIDTVKVIVVNGMSNITPVLKPARLKHVPEINIFMIGNSYSADCMRYTSDIGAADGFKINYGMLVRGAATAKFHYDNMEIPVSQSQSAFHYNGTNMGAATLKSVLEDERYKWDYIVIQDYGTHLVDGSEYNSAPVAGIAEYVHRKSPESEIILHEIWSNEVGSSDGVTVTDTEFQKVLNSRIHERITKAAEDAAAAIGFNKPLRILSSLNVIQAAREYVTPEGLDIFNTVFDKSKHTFSDDRLGGSAGDITGSGVGSQKIKVGQGLLSDADEAAGRKRLHRDGYHVSLLGRYLNSANAYTFFTGRAVSGNLFRPGSEALDCGVFSTAGEWRAAYLEFDAPFEEDIVLLQSICDGVNN